MRAPDHFPDKNQEAFGGMASHPVTDMPPLESAQAPLRLADSLMVVLADAGGYPLPSCVPTFRRALLGEVAGECDALEDDEDEDEVHEEDAELRRALALSAFIDGDA